MFRKILFSVLISVFLLSSFVFVSQEYRAAVTQSASERPLVASSALTASVTELSMTVPAAAPTILFHRPRQEADRIRKPTLSLAFDQPFDPGVDQTSGGAALTVEPAVQGEAPWMKTVFSLLPTNPLAAGSSYTFTLSPTAQSRQGAPLAAPYIWRNRRLDAQSIAPAHEMEAAQQSARTITVYRE